MVTVDRLLDDKAEGMAAIKIMAPIAQVLIFLDTLPLAVTAATIISYKLNEDVIVANKNNNKNKAKNKPPKGISEKIDGKTMNNKPGPSAGS